MAAIMDKEVEDSDTDDNRFLTIKITDFKTISEEEK